ncbi:alkaline phosphatase family protein [Alteromonadaceae bacterium M269]|nr:alkaline phosphatase family protein [Alteromonadaceae bacterium M269]
MNTKVTYFLFFLSLFFTGHLYSKEQSPLVIMIGVDGLRPDSITEELTPSINKLGNQGVRAKSMTPAMPSKTFVNFYTLATGLHPENHGMISNAPYDRKIGRKFENGRDSQNPEWWHGEPIWISAEKQGLIAATYFWVGSEVPIDDIHPTYWKPYNKSKDYGERVDEVLGWLKLPEGKPPNLINMYFSAVDSASHDHGLRSDEEKQALATVDGHIGDLIKGLKTLGLYEEANIIVVSDHGMVDLSDDRIINLDQWVDLNDFNIPDWSKNRGPAYEPFLSVFGKQDKIEQLYSSLQGKHKNMRVLKRSEFDALYYFNHPQRAPELMILADPGWTLYTSEDKAKPLSLKAADKLVATHGYDNQHPSMRASFLASGPAFKSKEVVEAFDNVEVYGIVACVLGIEPAGTNGDIKRVQHLFNKSCH